MIRPVSLRDDGGSRHILDYHLGFPNRQPVTRGRNSRASVSRRSGCQSASAWRTPGPGGRARIEWIISYREQLQGDVAGPSGTRAGGFMELTIQCPDCGAVSHVPQLESAVTAKCRQCGAGRDLHAESIEAGEL